MDSPLTLLIKSIDILNTQKNTLKKLGNFSILENEICLFKI